MQDPPTRPRTDNNIFTPPSPLSPDSMPPTIRRLRGDPSVSVNTSVFEAIPFDLEEPISDPRLMPDIAQPSAQIRALRKNQLAIATLIITSSFFISRILGILRYSLFTSTFSFKTSFAADAYTLAFTLPNAVYNLVAGGAIGSAFIPVFTDYLVNKRDRKTAWLITSAALNITTLLLILFAAFAFIFMRQLTFLYAAYIFKNPAEVDQVVLLSRIMLIQPILLGLYVISSSVLQTRQLFLLPAIGSVLYNIGQVGGIIATIVDRQTHIFGGHLEILGPTYGVVAAALLQFIIQIPGLIGGKMKYTLTFNFRLPGIVAIAKSMVPRIVNSFMLYVVLAFATTTLLTSLNNQGAVAGYTTAFQVALLPVGIFGMALSQAAFPSLATFVAARDWERMRSTVLSGVRVILYLSIPTSLGLMILADPIVRLLFVQGQFSSDQISLIASPLIFFAVGVPALATIEIVVRAFYAIQDARTAVIVSIMELFFVIALSVLLLDPLGAGGVALATSIGITGETTTLLLLLRRKHRLGYFSMQPLIAFIFGVLAASMVAILATLLVYKAMDAAFQQYLPIDVAATPSGLKIKLFLLTELIISGIVGAVVYYLAARFLGIEDTVPIDLVFARIGRKMGFGRNKKRS